MSHTYVQNLLHVVFSTKERRKLIPLDHRTKLWAFMAGVCSKEKIVPLEIGGADTLDNIWPQCGPKNVVLARRYFKQKDLVENYLADKVKTEVTDPRQLANLQKLIAEDWTQLLPQAQTWCAQPGHHC